ncbi:MAG: GNAT family N-acetyltransferase [Candidatus Riflebacteria bacterium]|nr:GNAT family N-acetyltransferase [Candidatus Riflebacteria bacterium]
MDGIECGLADERDWPEWEAFLRRSPGATPFHARPWHAALVAGLGHGAAHLVARQQGAIVGVLPLFTVSPPWGRPFLVSVPAANHAGPIAPEASARSALITRAVRETEERGLAYLELRTAERPAPAPGLASVPDRYVTYRIALDRSAESVWSRLPGKIRTAVRKARKLGTVVVSGREGRDLAEFMLVYRSAMDRLGSPGFGEPFFRALLDSFGEGATIFRATRQGRTVAADFVVEGFGLLAPIYAGQTEEGRAVSANYLVSWAGIEHGCGHGAAVYDFGRSSVNTPAARFKARWGGQQVALTYHYHMSSGGPPPDRDPHRPLFRLAARCWRRLPAAVRWWLGPRIVRYLH